MSIRYCTPWTVSDIELHLSQNNKTHRIGFLIHMHFNLSYDLGCYDADSTPLTRESTDMRYNLVTIIDFIEQKIKEMISNE